VSASAIQLPAPTSQPAAPRGRASGRVQQATTDQRRFDSQRASVGGGTTSGTDQDVVHTHAMPVGSGSSSAPAHDQLASGTHTTSVGAGAEGHDPAITSPPPRGAAPGRDQDLLLYLYADHLDDLEKLRIATENRLRTLTDETEHGKGIPADLPEVVLLTNQLDQLRTLEHGATLALKRAMRAHYLGPWCKQTVGVGEKQLARLLAAIGNPAWNDLHQRPRRGPAELWAYAGLHVIEGQAARRRKGVKANWSTDAKTRAWLIATSCVKQAHSPYRAVYDRVREHQADAVHTAPCVRCGPSGKPASEGSPLSAGHQHARALRAVSKELLKDLWREAKRTMEAPS
jgi:hypothetical protein